MTISLWLSLVVICCLGAMTPGPSLAIVLKHTFAGKASHGIVTSVAHGLGVGLYALLAILGLDTLIRQYPTFFQFFMIAGALYLIYLGINAWKSSLSAAKSDTSEQKTINTSYLKAAKEGFSIAFLNPKLALFFTALFSQFINPETMSITVAVIMVATVLVIDTIWYIIVSFVAASQKERFGLSINTPWLARVIGTLFILLAVRVLSTIDFGVIGLAN